MAVKNFTREPQGGGSELITWAGLGNGDTGAPAQVCSHPDKTAQLTGTLSTGGELTLQGSMDGSTWFTLTDTAGTAIVLTALGASCITENPVFIRPNITGGDGSTDLTVSMLALDK